MKSRIRRHEKTLWGDGHRTVTYSEGEWAVRGCLSGLLNITIGWPLKILYWVSIGWIIALFRRRH